MHVDIKSRFQLKFQLKKRALNDNKGTDPFIFDLNQADSTFMNHRGVLYAPDEALAKLIVGIYKNLVDNP